MGELLCGEGGFTSELESMWELDRCGDLYNTVNILNIHLILANFMACKFYLIELFLKQKKEEIYFSGQEAAISFTGN